MAVGTLTAIGAGLGAAAGLAKGIGGAVAARRSFSEEDEKRLQRLVRDRAMGRLGLTGRQEGELRSDLGGTVTSMQQATEQATLRGAAAAGAQGAAGARDVFLARMASQQQAAEAQRDVEREVARADAAERAAQQQELRALTAAKAESRAEAARALTGGLVQAATAGGEVALQRAASREALAIRQAELGVAETPDVASVLYPPESAAFRSRFYRPSGSLSAEFLKPRSL
jgi:hypothetical protein